MQESRVEFFSIIVKPSWCTILNYNMLYTKFEKLLYLKSRSKIYLKLIGGILFKNNFTLKI